MSDLTPMEYVIRELKTMNSQLDALNGNMSRIANALEEKNVQNYDYEISKSLEKIKTALVCIAEK